MLNEFEVVIQLFFWVWLLSAAKDGVGCKGFLPRSKQCKVHYVDVDKTRQMTGMKVVEQELIITMFLSFG